MPKHRLGCGVALWLLIAAVVAGLDAATASDTRAAGQGVVGATPLQPQPRSGVSKPYPGFPSRDPRSQQPRGTARLSGRVVDESTQAPLRNAFVTLSGFAHRTAQTDDEGRFAFAELPAGRYTVTARKAGYVEPRSGPPRRRGHRRPFTVNEGEVLEHVAVRLSPGAVLTGTVVDEAGEPIVRAFVRAVMPGRSEQLAQGVMMSSDETDDQGTFRIHSLPSGDYLVAVDTEQPEHIIFSDPGPTGTMTEATPQRGYARTFHPGTFDAAQAQPVSVEAGEERSLDFTLTPVQLSSISGIIVGPTGLYPMVSLRPDTDFDMGDLGGSNASVQPNGTYVISRVVPGRYLLTARSGGNPEEEQISIAELPVEVTEEPITGLSVTMAPAGTVSGEVVWDGDPTPPLTTSPSQTGTAAAVVGVIGGLAPGEPMPAALSEARSAGFDKVRIHASPLRPGHFPVHGGPAELDSDNRFTLTNVFGALRLHASGLPPGWLMKTIEAQGHDVTAAGLKVDAGQSVNVRVIVTNRLARLVGTVADEQGGPAADAYVLLLDPSLQPRAPFEAPFPRMSPTRADGTFVLDAVLPGRYIAAAIDAPPFPGIDDTDLLEQIAASGRTVELEALQEQRVSLGLFELPEN
ncbi:MAG: hypothetical protein GEU99_05035 [Luteitalea sp.]|nr:hypothetical protein [Luteitalea sp.]